jgi:hypothetical protein
LSSSAITTSTPVDSAVPSTEPQTDAGATTLPVPVLVTTTAPHSLADAAIVAMGEQINKDSADLVQTLMAADDSFIEPAGYAWDLQSATVSVSATLSPAATEDVAMTGPVGISGARSEPVRSGQPGGSVRPDPGPSR